MRVIKKEMALPGSNKAGAQIIAEAMLESQNGNGFISAIPASSGIVARSGPKKTTYEDAGQAEAPEEHQTLSKQFGMAAEPPAAFKQMPIPAPEPPRHRVTQNGAQDRTGE